MKTQIRSLLTLVCAASASLLIMASCGYTVTLHQVGPNVVATGRGPIDLTGLSIMSYHVATETDIEPANGGIFTGTSAFADLYHGTLSGPASFGSGSATFTQRASGDMVGIHKMQDLIVVPTGYVSGTALSNTATWRGHTFATLGVTPGTYVWKWGTGLHQKVMLVIPPAINISNISTRASVQTGQGVAIAGFIVLGTDQKQVLIRGLGPTLTNFNLTGVLADPRLGLYDGSGTLISSNNDWKNADQAAIQATGLAPSFDVESAILITLQPGNYTAILSGNNGTTGLGLVEIYDLDTAPTSELFNVSTRGFVGSGDSVVIAGFIASGDNGSYTQVLVRGLGPTLARPQFGVLGTLADPVVTLVDANGNVVQSNNNWKDSQQTEIKATGFAPPNDLEAAMLAPVAAGNYTAILSGNGGGTGIGLVEVYK